MTTADYTTPSSRQLGAWAEEMASGFGGFKAVGTSFGESWFPAGRSFDHSDVCEGSFIETSNSRVLVERDKARRGPMGYC